MFCSLAFTFITLQRSFVYDAHLAAAIHHSGQCC